MFSNRFLSLIVTKSVTVGSADREQNVKSDGFKVIDKSWRDGRKQSDERIWKGIYKWKKKKNSCLRLYWIQRQKQLSQIS